MRNALTISVFLVLFLLGFAAHARAEMNLVPQAGLSVSSVAQAAGMPMDSLQGRAALRDGDPDTAWVSKAGEPGWVSIDLSSDGGPIGVTLERIELVWGESWPADIWISCGPDPLTQRTLYSGAIVDPNSLSVTPPETWTDVRVCRLRFSSGGFQLAELGVYASDAPAIDAAPAPALSEGALGITELNWDALANAHHYEIERRREGASEPEIVWQAYSAFAQDRPPEAGNYDYRVRAIDYAGRAGAWSDSVTLADYAPAEPPNPALMTGMVEGFYGAPYTMKKRNAIVRLLGLWGMNTYIYAPKRDARHRAKWREPYDDAQMDDFAELLAQGRAMGVEVCYAIAPGLDMDPLLIDDFEALTAKFRDFMDRGYGCFALLMDDIGVDVDAASGANHADLVNRLYDWLLNENAETRLLFVPTAYSGTAGVFNTDERAYLEALAAIPEAVTIGWTGQGVFDDQITASELESYAELVAHDIWIWDNYPVNDFDLGLGMYLGPISGRGPGLFQSERLAGVLANPMIEGMASMFAMASYAELFHDPAAYDPNEDRLELVRKALDAEMPSIYWERLQGLFSDFRDWSQVQNAPELAEAVEDFLQALSLGGTEMLSVQTGALLDELFRLRVLTRSFGGETRARMLSDELDERMRKLGARIDAAVIAVNLLQAELFGQSYRFFAERMRYAELAENELAIAYDVLDDALKPLFDKLDEGVEPRFSASVLPIMAEPPETAREGQPLYFDAGFGLQPEVSVEVVSEEMFADDIEIGNKGLMQVLPQPQTLAAAQGGLRWYRVDTVQSGARIAAFMAVDVWPALAELDGNHLEITTEMKRVGEMDVLLQNGRVVPDWSYSSHSRTSLNGEWRAKRHVADLGLSFSARTPERVVLMAEESLGALLPEYNDDDWLSVSLPGALNRMPPVGEDAQPERFWGGAWLRKRVLLPSDAKDVRLVIAKAAYLVDVFADGIYLGYHEGAHAPALLPLPETLWDRSEVTLAIRVHCPKPGDVPGMLPGATDLDWMPYCGVLGDIYWEYLPAAKPAVIARVNAISTTRGGSLRVDIAIRSFEQTPIEAQVSVDADRLDREKTGYFNENGLNEAASTQMRVTGRTREQITLNPNGEITSIRMELRINSVTPWSFSAPEMVLLEIGLTASEDDYRLDTLRIPVAFREPMVIDDGRFTLNSELAMLTGVRWFGDNPYPAGALSWQAAMSDLAQMHTLGAMMVHVDRRPLPVNVYALMDRMGMAAQVALPMHGLSTEELSELDARGLAMGVWNEMSVALMNRGSALFWNPCPGCEAGPELEAFYSEIAAKSEGYGWTNVLVHGVSPEAIDGMPSQAALALLDGAIAHDDASDVDAAVDAAIVALRERYPEKPQMLILEGYPSGADGAEISRQRRYASEYWNGASPHFQLDEKGRDNHDGYVMGWGWSSMYDHYSLGAGFESGGLFHQNRQSLKPAAEWLEPHFGYYTGQKAQSGDGGLTPNVVDEKTGCRSVPSAGAVPLILMLMLALVHGRRRLLRREHT